MTKLLIVSAITMALGVTVTNANTISVDVTQTLFGAKLQDIIEGTLSDNAGDFGLIESVHSIVGTPSAYAAVSFFEIGSSPILDNDTVTDSLNITNGTTPTDFGVFTQTTLDNGNDSFTWAGTSIQGNYSYGFSLTEGQVAWGMLFNWNGIQGIPILNIMDCGLGNTGDTCSGVDTPMQVGPFAGSAFRFDGVVSAVPVPGAAWLMLSGLAGIAGYSYRNKKKKHPDVLS
jgi:hypothetical protein